MFVKLQNLGFIADISEVEMVYEQIHNWNYTSTDWLSLDLVMLLQFL